MCVHGVGLGDVLVDRQAVQGMNPNPLHVHTHMLVCYVLMSCVNPGCPARGVCSNCVLPSKCSLAGWQPRSAGRGCWQVPSQGLQPWLAVSC